MDGSVTFKEAIANTEPFKTFQLKLEKPINVHKLVGNIKVTDFPANDDIHDSGKKKLQFLDVIAGHNGTFNFKEIETLFIQQFQNRMTSRNLTPFNKQLFITPARPRNLPPCEAHQVGRQQEAQPFRHLEHGLKSGFNYTDIR